MPCLTKDSSRKFLDAIRRGEISPQKLVGMSSRERQALFGRIVGPENAQWVNALAESKILLKDQQRGMVSWAKKVSGLSEPAKRDLISRVQKMDRVLDPASSNAFLESLAAKKLGFEVTLDEAKNVSSLASEVAKKKSSIKESDPRASQSRMEYGTAVALFKNYVGDLKLAAGKVTPTWYLKHPFQSIVKLGGVSKSMLSTLDNSFFGRQGLKMFFTNPDIWAKSFVKSWGDIGKELVGTDAMLPIRADIYSRPNALNGKYGAAKVDLGIASEEAFPSHVLTKIPIAGRAAAAAESAFNGAALRMRADYADRMIATAERNGINVLDPVQAESIGKLVNSMTGRGAIGRLETVGQEVNSLFFSLKLLKSNWDTLTAHQFQKGVTPFVRKQAAMNLVKIIGGVAGVYFMARKAGYEPELDPRSSKFGQIKVRGTWFNVTGGMNSIATLAARMVPTRHNGQWGFWRRDANGKFVKLGTDKFGSKDPLDVAEDFTEGKFAPLPAFLRDYYRGRDFQGRPTRLRDSMIPTLSSFASAAAPIGIQNFSETMSNPDAAPLLATTILDGLGIGATTPPPKSAYKSKAPENWLEEIRLMLGKQ